MKKPIKRILGLFFGIAFLLSIAFPALAAYTHFESGVVTETGFYVGAYGTETEVIDADGNFTIVNAEITTADIETLSLGGTVITSTAADINTLTGVASQFIVYQVEDLAADGDISARPLFVCPEGFKFTISSINIIAQGSASGIDDSNTCVIAALNGTDSIVSKTYDTDPAFPADGVADSLGALSGTYKILAAGDILKFSITNGSTADTPAMILQVVGELATVSE
jgi:hypothetical protein